MFPNDDNFESEFTFESSAAIPLSDEPPFHVLILGDWSGNADRQDLNRRPLIEIDRDNFDETLNRLRVTLDLDLYGDGNSVLSLSFSEIDDFHPDNLFRSVQLFSDLRDVRRRLGNPDTFESAAAEVRSWGYAAADSPVDEAEISSQIEDAPPVEANNLLDMILTQPSGTNASIRPKLVDNSELGRFVSKIVSPHLITIDENEQSKLIAALDETISELMRTILHHPRFQALESAWRSLYFFVRRLETDSDLKVFVLDLSFDELTDNLKNINDLADSFLVRSLSAQSFAVIAGNYSFGMNVDDVAALMRIGQIAKAANAPFVSYIKPEIFGVRDFLQPSETLSMTVEENSKEAKLWTALRSLPEAGFLGLSPTRILLRMPFGQQTDSLETFSFEEFGENVNLENLLWMNPGMAIALVLAQSYRQSGWEMRSNSSRNIDNLPLFVFSEDGSSKTVPCAEVLLTESMLEKLLSQGMMPFVSFRDASNIRLATLQSISETNNDLRGGWDF
ncbi:MAG TPA: type VI secretion system contractile sheath large subunit [Pyrinomonadaceae bacterium]|jgi:type VI secretion system protein ImpC